MAVTEVIKNLDNFFRFTEGDKIIVNDLTYIDSLDMKTIERNLTTVYESDTINIAPSCDCGALKARYLLGTTCTECGSKCKDPRDKAAPILWLEALDPELPFITTAFWTMLSKLIYEKVDMLRWLSDPTYTPPTPVPNVILLAKEVVFNGERSYHSLVHNMDKFLDYLVESTELKAKANFSELLVLRNMYYEHTEDIFVTYMPIFNKKLMVVETTTKGIYLNLTLGDIKDVITLWLKACRKDSTLEAQSKATGIAISKLSKLYPKFFETFLVGKPGIIRKHAYGGRSGFTFRTVISASVGKHRHNEVVPPWVISLTVYRPHIMNLLVNREGMSYKEADTLINLSLTDYNPLIARLQQTLIAESPHEQGLPLVVNRNPALLQGSSLQLYIPEFNQCPKELVTTYSPLVAKNSNADFDGDELNKFPLLDNHMYNLFKTLKPYHSIPDLAKPGSVSGRLSLDTPNNTILANYLRDKEIKEGDDTLLSEL